jgi:hypothetical protein
VLILKEQGIMMEKILELIQSLFKIPKLVPIPVKSKKLPTKSRK